LTEIDESDDYVAVERIPSHEAYQWMVDFVDEIATPKDEYIAEKLSIALMGKGCAGYLGHPFRRIRDVRHKNRERASL